VFRKGDRGFQGVCGGSSAMYREIETAPITRIAPVSRQSVSPDPHLAEVAKITCNESPPGHQQAIPLSRRLGFTDESLYLVSNRGAR